jgi:hypothetical protein
MSASTAPAPSNAAAGYFVDQKKGEVNELKQVNLLPDAFQQIVSLKFGCDVYIYFVWWRTVIFRLWVVNDLTTHGRSIQLTLILVVSICLFVCIKVSYCIYWTLINFLIVAVAEEYQRRARCQAKTRNYQEGHRIHDPRHRCLPPLH